MGLYLLNLSVDTIAHIPSYVPQDLSVNDQESIVELIVEKVLGFEDAIKETDDSEREEHNDKKNTKIDFLVYQATNSKDDPYRSRSDKRQYLNHNDLITSDYLAIDTPPPKI